MFGRKKLFQTIQLLEDELNNTKKQLLDVLKDKNNQYDITEAVVEKYVPKENQKDALAMLATYKPEDKKNNLCRRVQKWLINSEYRNDFKKIAESLGRDCFLTMMTIEFVRYTSHSEDIAIYKITTEGTDEQMDYFNDRLKELYP
jgi:hypothetical protein